MCSLSLWAPVAHVRCTAWHFLKGKEKDTAWGSPWNSWGPVFLELLLLCPGEPSKVNYYPFGLEFCQAISYINGKTRHLPFHIKELSGKALGPEGSRAGSLCDPVIPCHQVILHTYLVPIFRALLLGRWNGLHLATGRVHTGSPFRMVTSSKSLPTSFPPELRNISFIIVWKNMTYSCVCCWNE